MGQQSSRARWGYAEFARIPGDRNRNEVIAGEIYASPPPSPLHQRALLRVLTRLNGFVEEHALGNVFIGPIDVLYGEQDFIEPDAVFVRRERDGFISDRGGPALILSVPDITIGFSETQ